MNIEIIRTKEIMNLCECGTLMDFFRYAKRHGLTGRIYPRNGEKRYFAALIYDAGRSQHFRDTNKED